jgi:hypothetical protein
MQIKKRFSSGNLSKKPSGNFILLNFEIYVYLLNQLKSTKNMNFDFNHNQIKYY